MFRIILSILLLIPIHGYSNAQTHPSRLSTTQIILTQEQYEAVSKLLLTLRQLGKAVSKLDSPEAADLLLPRLKETMQSTASFIEHFPKDDLRESWGLALLAYHDAALVISQGGKENGLYDDQKIAKNWELDGIDLHYLAWKLVEIGDGLIIRAEDHLKRASIRSTLPNSVSLTDWKAPTPNMHYFEVGGGKVYQIGRGFSARFGKDEENRQFAIVTFPDDLDRDMAELAASAGKSSHDKILSLVVVAQIINLATGKGEGNNYPYLYTTNQNGYEEHLYATTSGRVAHIVINQETRESAKVWVSEKQTK